MRAPPTKTVTTTISTVPIGRINRILGYGPLSASGYSLRRGWTHVTCPLISKWMAFRENSEIDLKAAPKPGPFGRFYLQELINSVGLSDIWIATDPDGQTVA